MEVRLVQLLASFISVSADYALARLEFALRDPAVPAPPVIERLPDASEESLRVSWPQVEAQLDAAVAYTKHLPPARSNDDEKGPTAWLRRTVREMDQYARAIRWVLTVTER
jgi:hypothetical protein